MTIATPTVLASYADYEYVKFFRFIVTHPKAKIWENLPDFLKRGNTSKQASDFIVKFRFFSEKNIVDTCLFVFFFSWGDCIKPKFQDKWEGTHSNINLKVFFKWPYRLGQRKVFFSAILSKLGFYLKEDKFAIHLKFWEVIWFNSISNYILGFSVAKEVMPRDGSTRSNQVDSRYVWLFVITYQL